MRFSPTILIALTLIAYPMVQAQSSTEVCAINRNAPPVSASYWPPDTSVNVYLDRNMFTSEERATLLKAMDNWTLSAANTGAGVKFVYAGEIDGMVNCNQCLTVTRREVYKTDRKHYAFFNPLKRDETGLLISAWIDLDFATTNPQALQGFMAHELGHGLGLWDCASCKKKQTIMNYFPGINRTNGLVEPSFCDLQTVRHVYQLERTFANKGMSDKAEAKIGN